jgi:hypothetical protein
MSSATPPRTTTRDEPREERPAVRAKGTVRPSYPTGHQSWTKVGFKGMPTERPITASRTISGSTSWRSSSGLSSRQQTPCRSSTCLAHFAGSGASSPLTAASMAHTGGLDVSDSSRRCRLRVTDDVAAAVADLTTVDILGACERTRRRERDQVLRHVPHEPGSPTTLWVQITQP